MLTNTIFRLALAAAVVCFSCESFAQRGGGGGGGRGARGGGMCRGGTGSSGTMSAEMGGRMRSGAAMAQGAGASGMRAGGMAAMNVRNQMAQSQNAGAATSFQGNMIPQPTPEQFVQTAMQFDRDHDQQLDREELGLVAAAVISELRSRQLPARRTRQQASRSRRSDVTDRSQPTMKDTFVNRAMTFDRNNDGTLSTSETTRMAKALIRSLS